jgi:zinc protease
VQERLGASYHPRSSTRLSRVYPGDGAIVIEAMADPDKVETLTEACLTTAHDLATQGVSEEEVDRLRQPLLNRLRDRQRENGYWLEALSGSQLQPRQLDDVRQETLQLRELKAETVTALAREYLKRERASVLVVTPPKAAAAAPAPQP